MPNQCKGDQSKQLSKSDLQLAVGFKKIVTLLVRTEKQMVAPGDKGRWYQVRKKISVSVCTGVVRKVKLGCAGSALGLGTIMVSHNLLKSII